jgi:hypothetical protein
MEQSVRAYLVPALVNIGFVVDPKSGGFDEGEDVEKLQGTSPSWGQLVRIRGATRDRIGIQFSTYGRAAFTINASARLQVSEDKERLLYSFRTDARARFRPVLRALRLGNQGSWFSLFCWRLRSPVQAKYDKLSLKAVLIVPDIDTALRENKTGPNVLRLYQAKH